MQSDEGRVFRTKNSKYKESQRNEFAMPKKKDRGYSEGFVNRKDEERGVQ